MPFGKLYATVAEVAGWEDYSFPEISSERLLTLKTGRQQFLLLTCSV